MILARCIGCVLWLILGVSCVQADISLKYYNGGPDFNMNMTYEEGQKYLERFCHSVERDWIRKEPPFYYTFVKTKTKRRDIIEISNGVCLCSSKKPSEWRRPGSKHMACKIEEKHGLDEEGNVISFGRAEKLNPYMKFDKASLQFLLHIQKQKTEKEK